MRITGGLARGRRIRGPRGSSIRPTSDRVREALFDVLGSRVPDSHFLDAYAGTGAVGIEALSRGADRVVFIERDRRAIRLIEANIAIERWGGTHRIIEDEALGALRRLARQRERFSVVFVDPPYDDPALPEALGLTARVLLPGGLIVVEHRTGSEIAPSPHGVLLLRRSYRYGDSSLAILEPRAGRG